MKDLQHLLEECLRKLSNGTATLDECLALYPDHAEQLKPLLEIAFLLNSRSGIMPSPKFNEFGRFALIQYAQSHPRRQLQGILYSWRMGVTLAMLVVAFLVTGTVNAQSALPGDIDYGWKRTSESAWRALTSDPVAADIILSQRRLNEWIAVAKDPTLNTSAMNDYQEALSKLKSTEDVETLTLIVPMLQSQQDTLNDAGLSTPELDNYLVEVADLLPADAPTQVARLEILPTEVSPTATFTPTPTARDIPTPTPTYTPTPTATDTPTPTDIPPTATDTPTPTATDTDTPTPTDTDTPTPTDTNTPVPTDTNTPIPTSTDVPLLSLPPGVFLP